MMYEECPYCGDHNDPGEKCDCQKEEAPTAGTVRTSRLLKNTYIHNSTEREVCQDVY